MKTLERDFLYLENECLQYIRNASVYINSIYMNIGSLLHNLPNDWKSKVNKLIKTHKKLAQCDNAITFNGLCLKEDLLPAFTNIKVHDPAARKEAFTKEYRRKLVQHEYQRKEKLATELREKVR